MKKSFGSDSAGRSKFATNNVAGEFRHHGGGRDGGHHGGRRTGLLDKASLRAKPLSSAKSLPKPVNLPSLRSENRGMDPMTQLVPGTAAVASGDATRGAHGGAPSSVWRSSSASAPSASTSSSGTVAVSTGSSGLLPSSGGNAPTSSAMDDVSSSAGARGISSTGKGSSVGIVRTVLKRPTPDGSAKGARASVHTVVEGGKDAAEASGITASEKAPADSANERSGKGTATGAKSAPAWGGASGPAPTPLKFEDFPDPAPQYKRPPNPFARSGGPYGRGAESEIEQIREINRRSGFGRRGEALYGGAPEEFPEQEGVTAAAEVPFTSRLDEPGDVRVLDGGHGAPQRSLSPNRDGGPSVPAAHTDALDAAPSSAASDLPQDPRLAATQVEMPQDPRMQSTRERRADLPRDPRVAERQGAMRAKPPATRQASDAPVDAAVSSDSYGRTGGYQSRVDDTSPSMASAHRNLEAGNVKVMRRPVGESARTAQPHAAAGSRTGTRSAIAPQQQARGVEQRQERLSGRQGHGAGESAPRVLRRKEGPGQGLPLPGAQSAAPGAPASHTSARQSASAVTSVSTKGSEMGYAAPHVGQHSQVSVAGSPEEIAIGLGPFSSLDAGVATTDGPKLSALANAVQEAAASRAGSSSTARFETAPYPNAAQSAHASSYAGWEELPSAERAHGQPRPHAQGTQYRLQGHARGYTAPEYYDTQGTAVGGASLSDMHSEGVMAAGAPQWHQAHGDLSLRGPSLPGMGMTLPAYGLDRSGGQGSETGYYAAMGSVPALGYAFGVAPFYATAQTPGAMYAVRATSADALGLGQLTAVDQSGTPIIVRQEEEAFWHGGHPGSQSNQGQAVGGMHRLHAPAKQYPSGGVHSHAQGYVGSSGHATAPGVHAARVERDTALHVDRGVHQFGAVHGGVSANAYSGDDISFAVHAHEREASDSLGPGKSRSLAASGRGTSAHDHAATHGGLPEGTPLAQGAKRGRGNARGRSVRGAESRVSQRSKGSRSHRGSDRRAADTEEVGGAFDQDLDKFVSDLTNELPHDSEEEGGDRSLAGQNGAVPAADPSGAHRSSRRQRGARGRRHDTSHAGAARAEPGAPPSDEVAGIKAPSRSAGRRQREDRRGGRGRGAARNSQAATASAVPTQDAKQIERTGESGAREGGDRGARQARRRRGGARAEGGQDGSRTRGANAPSAPPAPPAPPAAQPSADGSNQSRQRRRGRGGRGPRGTEGRKEGREQHGSDK